MRRSLIVAGILALVIGACGDDSSADLPVVSEGWARATAGPNGAVYASITAGSEDLTLVGVEVSEEIAPRAALHETSMGSDGAMAMSPVSGIEIPAGTTVDLAPGGFHVMMMGLGEPLEVGDSFTMTFLFDDGTDWAVSVEVRDE